MRRLIADIVVLGAVICVSSDIASGSEWNLVYLNISPNHPTTSDPITLYAWTWFGDPGQRFVSVAYSKNEHLIDVDVVMQDLHAPGTGWITVMTPGGGSVNCGNLAQGFYDVMATISVIPWGGDFPVPFRSGNFSFNVIYEPATIVWKGGISSNPTDWDQVGNWIPSMLVPNGAGITVIFGNQTPTNNVVNINSTNKTVANITFHITTSTTIQSSGGYNLTLDNPGSASTIDIAGSHTISVQVILNNDARITGSGILNLSCGMSGNHALSISNNVTAQSIQVNALTINSGAKLRIAPVGTAGMASVPEPSTLILLAAGALGLLPYAWRRRKG